MNLEKQLICNHFGADGVRGIHLIIFVYRTMGRMVYFLELGAET